MTPEEALSSWHLRTEVANDRDAEVRMGCARHCEKTALLAGCLYAVGARKGMSECEERMMVSPAFMRSIAARDRVRVLVMCGLSCGSGRERPMVYLLCWLVAHSPACLHLRTFCACLSGVLACVRGFAANSLPHDSCVLLDSLRRQQLSRATKQRPLDFCLAARTYYYWLQQTAPWHTITVHLLELSAVASLAMARPVWHLQAWTRRLLLLKRSSTYLESTSMHQ
jgi:hypothetical protein